MLFKCRFIAGKALCFVFIVASEQEKVATALFWGGRDWKGQRVRAVWACLSVSGESENKHDINFTCVCLSFNDSMTI